MKTQATKAHGPNENIRKKSGKFKMHKMQLLCLGAVSWENKMEKHGSAIY